MKKLVAVAILLIATSLAEAQRGRRFFDQNDPPDTEFIFARLHYTAGRNMYGGSGWAHDYPIAEEHILQVMDEATGLDVKYLSYRIVELGSPDIFQYPFTYISEPGEMWLTEQEVMNLREYINRGGFIMIDDFDGPYDLEQLRRNLLRAFPEREMFPLTPDHEIFHSFYDIDSTAARAPYAYGGNPMFYGFPDGKGGISMIICHNNDVGDFWEHIDEGRFPLAPSTESLRLGINFVLYAMTH